MKPPIQRLLSGLLVAAYAVLALFGAALHRCTAPKAAADVRVACADACCLLRCAADPPASGKAAWEQADSSTDSGHDACAVCRALSQLKLGKAALPAGLPDAFDDVLSRVDSDRETPSAELPTHPARGPPAAGVTV